MIEHLDVRRAGETVIKLAGMVFTPVMGPAVAALDSTVAPSIRNRVRDNVIQPDSVEFHVHIYRELIRTVADSIRRRLEKGGMHD